MHAHPAVLWIRELKTPVFVIALLALTGAAAPPDMTAARAFLVKVYAHYPTRESSKFELFGKDERRVFDSSLASLIDEDTRLAGGEVGALDGDPLCDCQDDTGDSFTLGGARADGPNGAVIEVVRHDHNVRPPAAETIRIALRRVGGVWRIHDVGSPDMPSLRAYLTEENRKRRR